MDTKTMAWIFLFAVAVIAVVAIVPIALIWALNTLFPALAIPVNWSTWFAMLLVSAVLSARAAK